MVVLVAFPLLYTLLASFKGNQELLTGGASIMPKKFVFDNYKDAWGITDFKTYTWNSVYMTFFVVLGVIATSTMAGYSFARSDFKGKKLIFAVFVSTMFISLGSITMYPLLKITRLLHLNQSLWSVIIIRIFGLNITSIYLVKGYVNSLPKELEEAAELLLTTTIGGVPKISCGADCGYRFIFCCQGSGGVMSPKSCGSVFWICVGTCGISIVERWTSGL